MKTLAKYLAIFCLAFALAGITGYTGVSLFTRSAPEVILPDLVGQNIIQVLETLTRMGLNPKLHTTQYHDTIPKYGVTFQDPAPGSTIKKGRDVIIYLSKGFKENRVPDLRELALNEALLTLEAMELKVGRILYVHSDRTSKQAVISQYPLADTTVPANTPCDLLVSKGPVPMPLAMPDLEKQSLNLAIEKVEAVNLTLARINTIRTPGRLPDTVIRQTPLPGTRVIPGTNVSLTVNRSEKQATVDPQALTTPVWISHSLPPGFANRHVKITMDIFGTRADAFNGFMKPGKNINLLIPGGIKTKIRIFVDHELTFVKTIDPWAPTDNLPWIYRDKKIKF